MSVIAFKNLKPANVYLPIFDDKKLFEGITYSHLVRKWKKKLGLPDTVIYQEFFRLIEQIFFQSLYLIFTCALMCAVKITT